MAALWLCWTWHLSSTCSGMLEGKQQFHLHKTIQRHVETDKSTTGHTPSQAQIEDIIPESELRETLTLDRQQE